MQASRFWLVGLAALVALGGLSTAAAADDAEACERLSGDRAVAACSRAIATDRYKGGSLAALYANRGDAWYFKGAIDRAIADYDEAIRIDPGNVSAYTGRGNVRLDKGDLSRAIADYDEAIRLDSRHALAYSHRGVAYFYKGDDDRAIASLDKAIQIAPRYADAYVYRGKVWYDKNDYDRAIADYDQAIRIDPKLVKAYIDRGEVRGTRGDYSRALADLDEAIRLDPRNAFAYSVRGEIHAAEGHYDGAIADFDMAIRLSPRFAHAYNHRGMAYAAKGDKQRAIADYDAAIRLSPKYAHAYDNRSEAWSDMGDFGRAIADFDEASRLKPESSACAPEPGRVIRCIRPSVTDPAIRRFDSPSYVLFNDNVGPAANLLVFLPGTDGRPPGPLPFLRAAADAGYRVISLATSDVPAVAQYCARKPDPACSGNFRRMRIYGDGTSLDPAIDNTPAESIVNRLAKLLQYLDRQEPQRGWGAYLENGAPKWSRIALAGQSQGAGMAAFIAQGHEVARVILFSSPWDFTLTGNTEKLAPWLSAPSRTPLQRWYAGYHEKEDTAALIARAYAALRIPTNHIRVFKAGLPGSQEVARRQNLYHLQGLYSPIYAGDRAFFLGRSP